MTALGLGLTETVSAKLVQAFDGGALQLVSTRDLLVHSVKTSKQARSEFGTDLVLEGSMQQEGTRIRITWSLVDPRTHTQIAANTITGESDDMFGLQDHLVDDVLERLPRAFEPGRRFALQGHQVTKLAAYDLPAFLRRDPFVVLSEVDRYVELYDLCHPDDLCHPGPVLSMHPVQVSSSVPPATPTRTGSGRNRTV